MCFLHVVSGPVLQDNRYDQEMAHQQRQPGHLYQAYPHEAPMQEQPRPSAGVQGGPVMQPREAAGQGVPLRASEGEDYFDPYAPVADQERRESSAGGDGYLPVLPPVYLVRHPELTRDRILCNRLIRTVRTSSSMRSGLARKGHVARRSCTALPNAGFSLGSLPHGSQGARSSAISGRSTAPG